MALLIQKILLYKVGGWPKKIVITCGEGGYQQGDSISCLYFCCMYCNFKCNCKCTVYIVFAVDLIFNGLMELCNNFANVM